MVFYTIALIGRRNVGKSALFNRLTRTCDALVGSNNTELTRDRRYGSFKWKDYEFIIIDTGGIEIVQSGISVSVYAQSIQAILEAHLILFIVDGRMGLSPYDRDIVRGLYKFQKSIFIVVNKIDYDGLEISGLEFYSLGIEKVIFVSAIHGRGIDFLLNEIFFEFRQKKTFLENKIFDKNEELKIFLKNPSIFLRGKGTEIIKLAVVGVPNVGKSTFINYILGENRMVVSPTPGTTRDSICTSMIYDNYKWIVIDTAGIRRRNKIISTAEEISVINSLRAIQNVTVVLLLINAYYGVNNYDLSLLNIILRSGKSLVIGVNKWDLLSNDLQEQFKIMYNNRMHFIPFVRKNFISSLSGWGVSCLLKSIIETHCSSFKFVSTSYLTRIMNLAVDKYPPPRVYGKHVKLRYAHMGGHVPFVVVIHGSNVTNLPECYKRYLANFFLQLLKISGLSICIRFKEGS